MICEISKVQLLWKGHSNESDPVKNQSPKVCGSTTLSHKNTLKSRGSDPALLPGKGMSVVGNNALGLVHKVFSFFKQSMATVLNGLLHPLPACDATSGFYLLPCKCSLLHFSQTQLFFAVLWWSLLVFVGLRVIGRASRFLLEWTAIADSQR